MHKPQIQNEPRNWDKAQGHAFAGLTPSRVVDALCALGFELDGRINSLSSYENRVYALSLEGEVNACVAKFYRPRRWSDAQIREEHAFALELQEAEIPVVAPWVVGGETLHHVQFTQDQAEVDEPDVLQEVERDVQTQGEHLSHRFCVYPQKGGRWPELDDGEVLEWIGRYLARIHTVGEQRSFAERPDLNPSTMGEEPRRFLMEHGAMDAHQKKAWGWVSERAIEKTQRLFERVNPRRIRVHGDCHPGNILWTPLGDGLPGGPHFVDLDDARMGPAVQDLWMLMGGSSQEKRFAQSCLLEGYESLRDFDRRELRLVEALRTLRMIHYSAWLAARVQDPAFRQHFAWFGSEAYWSEQIQNLNEQCDLMDEELAQE
jgi:Ser/Thr protein kinase RdoA (MazF antagonist)